MEENRNEMEMTDETMPMETFDETVENDEKRSGLGLGAIIGGAVVLGVVTAYKAVSNKIKKHKDEQAVKEEKPKKKKRRFHIGFIDVPEEESEVIDVPEEDVEVIDKEPEETK